MTPAYAYGWGATGPGPTADCADKDTLNILQETELRVFTEAEREEGFYTGTALLDNQLGAVGATSSTYSVTSLSSSRLGQAQYICTLYIRIFALNPQGYYAILPYLVMPLKIVTSNCTCKLDFLPSAFSWPFFVSRS